MKAGSLVELVEAIGELPPFIKCNRPCPKVGDVEMVDDISPLGGLSLVGFTFTILPPADVRIVAIHFDAKHWREIQPPMDISFISELQIEEV